MHSFLPRTRAATRALAVVALSLCLAPNANAQTPDTLPVLEDTSSGTSSLEISAVTGYQWFDKSSAIRNAPTIGIRILNPHIMPSVPGVSFGVNAAFARPTTRGDYFPWNRQIYYSDINRRNDTTLVFEVSQRLSLATYGAEAGYRLGAPHGLSAELSAGLGGYAFWEDPEQNHHNQVHSKLSYSLGGGIGVPLPGSTVLRFRVDDLIFTGYDRNWFSLYDPLFTEELWQNPVTPPPPPKRTIHNVRLSVQFSFLPTSGN